MKLTILRPDETRITAEGSPEELAAFVRASAPPDPFSNFRVQIRALDPTAFASLLSVNWFRPGPTDLA